MGGWVEGREGGRMGRRRVEGKGWSGWYVLCCDDGGEYHFDTHSHTHTHTHTHTYSRLLCYITKKIALPHINIICIAKVRIAETLTISRHRYPKAAIFFFIRVIISIFKHSDTYIYTSKELYFCLAVLVTRHVLIAWTTR